jgi:GNAT superfamily N-acetyltransferase
MRATRTYLELEALDDLRAVPPAPAGARIERLAPCPPSLYRYLYHEVGHAYRWTDRAAWSDATIEAHVARPAIALFALHAGQDDRLAGFFELEQGGDAVQIAYFGLLPHAIGRGLGAWLLGEAVRTAFGAGASRVWLHTCTLDHPAALPNYLARGFRITRAEQYEIAEESRP